MTTIPFRSGLNPFTGAAALALTLILTACGGGGGGGGSGVNTGHFTDSAVQGLTYSTATQSGTTDATGMFQFQSGETITFSVGGLVIGEPVPAKSVMTPLDLAPGASLLTTFAQVEKVRLTNNPLSAERIAFKKFANMLIFLQSLDGDANPDNGITIPAGVGALLSAGQIDFAQNFFDFSIDPALRAVTHQAAAMGLLSTGAIRKPGFALDHFYSAQGITQFFAVPLTLSTDTDADGNPNQIFTLTYDANGNRLTSSSDSDADGAPNRITTNTYDANGNQLTRSFDTDADGNPNQITTNTYDANGNRLTQSNDTDADGNPNSITTNTYDANGNRLTSSSDSDADGNPNSITTIVQQSANWTAVFFAID